MKVVNTNKLNLLWTYGILPIKHAVDNVKLKLANNLVTTEEGYGLDARQGPVIQRQIDEINGKLDNKVYAEKILAGKWNCSQTAAAYTIGNIDILPENIISITGIVNNDSAFLYSYAYENYVALGIRYVGAGAITNRNYRVIIQYRI